MFVSASYLENGYIRAVHSNGKNYSFPDDPNNRYRVALTEQGITIDPYVPPPQPTDDERIDTAFPQTDVARVIFEALFELTNRVIALEGGNPVTRPQLRQWLRNKLP